jgi:signal transduction histidine kinase
MELAVFRIVQEALSNCRQHSEARTATVLLDFLEDEIRVRVQDDGRGFVPPRTVVEYADLGHFGLMDIQERVSALGGQVLIESEPGHGTCLDVRFPLGGGSAPAQ